MNHSSKPVFDDIGIVFAKEETVTKEEVDNPTNQPAGQPTSQPVNRPDDQEEQPKDTQSSEELTERQDSPCLPFDPDAPVEQIRLSKKTYEITSQNLDFIETISFNLRKWHIEKREVVQTALELLAKDYEANAEQSYLLKKFVSRKPLSDSE